MNLGLTRLANARWRIDIEIDLAEKFSVCLTRECHKKAIATLVGAGKFFGRLFQYQRGTKRNVIQKEGSSPIRSSHSM